MDTDIVIQKDISNLIDLKDDFYARYYDNKRKTIAFLKINNGKEIINKIKNEGYDIDNLYQIMDAVLIINDTLKYYKEIKKWIYNFIIKYKTADEDTLSIAIKHFNIQVTELDISYHYLIFYSNTNEAHILHSIGPKKFWRDTYNKDWEDNNKIWIEAGGNTTYNEIYKKRKIVDKIVWLIPSYNLRNKIRGFLLRKIGLSAR